MGVNMRKHRIIVAIYRMIIAVVCSIGIVEQAKGMDKPYVMFYFFTILINILCGLFFVIMSIRRKNERVIEGGLVTSIILVMLVFHFMLRPTSDFYQHELGLNNLILHYIMPVLVVIDFYFLSGEKKIKCYHPIYWLIIPIGYLIFVYLKAAFGAPFYTGYGMSKYPYFFLDIDKMGMMKVLGMISTLVLFYLALGYAVLLLDYLMNKIRSVF